MAQAANDGQSPWHSGGLHGQRSAATFLGPPAIGTIDFALPVSQQPAHIQLTCRPLIPARQPTGHLRRKHRQPGPHLRNLDSADSPCPNGDTRT